MKLIAKKPCSFGGKKFFIGDEVPSNMVLNPEQKIAWGVLEQVEEEPVAAPVEAEVPVEAEAPVKVETPAEVKAPVKAEKPPKKAPVKKGGKKPAEEVGEQ